MPISSAERRVSATRGYLFDVRAWDPLTIGLTLVLVFGMATLACYLPARRASTINPVDALRME